MLLHKIENEERISVGRKSTPIWLIQHADARPDSKGHGEYGETGVEALILAQQQSRLVGIVVAQHDSKLHMVLQVFEVNDGYAGVEILFDVALISPTSQL